VACRTASLRACLSRTGARVPVALGWCSRSGGVASGREELHEVTVAGCSELETPELDHESRWDRIRDTHGVWVGSARHPWRSNGNKKERMSRSEPLPGAPTVGVPTRGPGSQLVNAACFLVPDVDARGNTVTHGFILVLATGPYVQQRGCARALYYLATGVLAVEDTSEAREGGKLPSLC